jgi:hypothetical protein
MSGVTSAPHRHADGGEGGDHSHDESVHHDHPDSIPHSHDHDHSHAPDPHAAGEGPTVLDIGGDIGALILRTPSELSGAEIEISPLANPGLRRHVAVHPRQLPGGATIFAAMYYSLQAGSYQLWGADGTAALTVEVEGGKIAECTWPEGVEATF